MKQSKLITVPIKAQSSKKHPEVHLAYITDKEQDLLIKKDLYGSLKGKPNRGPGGLPSLEGDFGSPTGRTYSPAPERDVSSHRATGEGGQQYTRTPTGTGETKTAGKAASAVGWITGSGPIKAIGAGLQFAGSKIFGPKVPPDQAGGASAKVIKRGGVKVSDRAISADRKRYTNLRHDQGDPGGEKHGPEGLMTTTLTTAPTADKSFGHQWDFKAYDNQQATTTPNVYDYSKAPYAKKGKLVRKYATGQEVKKRSLPPSKGPDSKGLPSILENSDYFTKLIGG